VADALARISRQFQACLRTLALAGHCLWLCGRATQNNLSQLSELPPELPQSHRIAEVPFFPQESNQCGPAALATVMNYRGKGVTPEELTDTVYLPERKGSLQVEIIARARQEDLLVYPLAQSLPDLIIETANDNPVLVLQNLGLGVLPKWHYAVVTGYDLSAKTVTLNSGKQQDYTISLKQFINTWQKADDWAIVVTQPANPPATAQPIAFVKAVNDLEQVGELTAAEAGYRAALVRWPSDKLALFGIGNFYHVQGNYKKAEKIYEQLIDNHPEFAEAWNNYAYLLLAEGCPDQARTSAACAVALSEEKEKYLATLEEINGEADKFYVEKKSQYSQCPRLQCPRPIPD